MTKSTKMLSQFGTKVDKQQTKIIGNLEKKVNVLERDSKAIDKVYSEAQSITGALAGTFNCLNLIAQGDDINSRDGNDIRIEWLKMKLYTNQVSVGTGTLVRYIIFQDTSNQGAAPVIADILTNSNTQSNYNVNNITLGNRFRILFDKTVAADFDKPITMHNVFIKGKRLNMCHYGGGSAVIAQVRKGALFLLTLVDQVASATNVVADWQIRFTH